MSKDYNFAFIYNVIAGNIYPIRRCICSINGYLSVLFDGVNIFFSVLFYPYPNWYNLTVMTMLTYNIQILTYITFHERFLLNPPTL